MKLTANNISFRYNKKSPRVLTDVSFSVSTGECVALSAPSGHGKTTLGLILGGILIPEKGSVTIDGTPLPKKGRCPVQVIRQHPEHAVNPKWQLRRVIDEALPESMSADENNVSALSDSLGIEPAWFNRYPTELSGGELQRFCVLRALLSGADFLICDEISTMLDVITAAQIWNTLLTHAKKNNTGIVAITHNENLAARISDRVVTL